MVHERQSTRLFRGLPASKDQNDGTSFSARWICASTKVHVHVLPVAEMTYIVGLSEESMIQRAREGTGLISSCLAQKNFKTPEIDVRIGEYVHRFHDDAFSEIHIDDVCLPPIWSKSCSAVGGDDTWEPGSLPVDAMVAYFF